MATGQKNSLQQMSDYRHGWVAGAGFKPHADTESVEWRNGWADGRQAFRDAMAQYREAAGLPPEQVVRTV